MQYSICFVKLDVIKKVIFKVNTKILDHRKKEKKIIQTVVSFRNKAYFFNVLSVIIYPEFTLHILMPQIAICIHICSEP